MSQPFAADRAEQLLTPDTPVTTAVGITLSALATRQASSVPVAAQGFSALRRVPTQPRLAGAMPAGARRMAPEMAWQVVTGAYLGLARRILAQRRARV
jgi:hypothetical protein